MLLLCTDLLYTLTEEGSKTVQLPPFSTPLSAAMEFYQSVKEDAEKNVRCNCFIALPILKMVNKVNILVKLILIFVNFTYKSNLNLK